MALTQKDIDTAQNKLIVNFGNDLQDLEIMKSNMTQILKLTQALNLKNYSANGSKIDVLYREYHELLSKIQERRRSSNISINDLFK